MAVSLLMRFARTQLHKLTGTVVILLSRQCDNDNRCYFMNIH